MYILEEPHKDFGFYSECEEKILSFKKITWAARETRAGEQEWRWTDQLRGCNCPSRKKQWFELGWWWWSLLVFGSHQHKDGVLSPGTEVIIEGVRKHGGTNWLWAEPWSTPVFIKRFRRQPSKGKASSFYQHIRNIFCIQAYLVSFSKP